MKAFTHSSWALLAGLSLSGLAACGGDDTSTGGGTTTTTSSQGGGGAGGTTASGGTTGGGGTTVTTGGGGQTGGTGGVGGTTGGTGGGGQSFDCTAPQGAIPALKLTPVANNMARPILVRSAPGDDERLFVVEQAGRIRIVKNGVLQDKPFLDITDRVHQPGGGDERGLLGLAFHPDYQQNGRFFVFYTDKSNQNGSKGDQNVVELSRADADTATSDANGFGIETKKLFTLLDTESNHNGGMLEFGPTDGYLYIGLGDGGGGGDGHGAFGNGQNLATLWGKILRVDVNVEMAPKPYGIPAGNMTAIPAGNPTVGEVEPEIWDYGLRNPWRFWFDPCTSDLYIGDVGQGSWEEVDIEPPGMGNRNYGWRLYEGTHEYNVGNYDTSNITMPVDEYPHTQNGMTIGCSISGGVVYRGSAIPGLRGTYFYGDYCSGKVWTFRWDGAAGVIQDKMERTDDLSPTGSIVSFGQDNLGNVYVVDIAGTVSRVDAE